MYCDSEGNSLPVLYEGANADGLLHTSRFVDGSKLAIHDSNIQLLDQPDFRICPRLHLTTGTRLAPVFPLKKHNILQDRVTCLLSNKI